MAKNPTPSLLDPGQIIKRAFNDDSDSLRVDAEITANISGPQEVVISDIDDSIKIGDGNGNFATITGGKLDVNSTASFSGAVEIDGLAAFQTSQYTIGTSSTQITITPLTNRSCLSIKIVATSGTDITYVGNSSSVTTSNGYPLFNGDTIQLDLKPTQAVWLVASSAGQKAYVMELGG